MNTSHRLDKTSTRLALLSIIIFSTSIIEVMGAPGSSADIDYPLFFIIDTTPVTPGGDSTFIFANHGSVLSSGNWIQLTGGAQHALPDITFTVEYPPDALTTISGSSIMVDSYQSSDSFTYPFAFHPVYLNGQTVTATFYGSPSLAGDSGLAWRLIPTSESLLQSAFSKAMNGDPSDLETLLSSGNSVWEDSGETLDGFGDASTSFTPPQSGTYGLFLVAETSSPYQIVVYGCTLVEVVDYSLSANVPSSVTRGHMLNVPTTITNPPGSTTGFTYGAVIINNNAYDFDVDLSSDSTIPGTSISINGEPIVEGSGTLGSATLLFPGITSLSSFDSTEITAKLSNIISSGNIAIGFSTQTTQTSQTLSISTTGLNTGTYRVLIGVWEDDALVGFTSDTVKLRTSTSGGGGGATPPPSSEVIDLLDPDDAYDLLESFSPQQIADVLEDVEPEHVADILAYFEAEEMYEILGNMPETKVSEVLEYMDAATIAEILENLPFDKIDIIKGLTQETAGQVLNTLNVDEAALLIPKLTTEDYKIIESMVANDLANSALVIEAAVKGILEEVDTETREALLGQLSDTLESMSVESLVNLFIEIAKLPETPSTVALLLEKMDPASVTLIVQNWVSLGQYESLADVLKFTTTPLLELIYMDIGNQGRLNIYTYLTKATIEKLPMISTILVSDLTVAPIEIETGDSLEISYALENTGEYADDYMVETFIETVSIDVQTGILDAGDTKEIVLLFEPPESGRFKVQVADQTEYFDVVSPAIITPATFVIDLIQTTPQNIVKGGTATVTVTVSNEGDVEGETSIDLLLDSDVVDTKQANIPAQSTSSIIFEVAVDYPVGVHEFSVNGVSAEITVTQPERRIPLTTIMVIVLIIAAAAVYMIRNKI